LTYLAFAVVCGLEPLARHVLDFGADVELADDQGRTPLCVACDKRMMEVVKLLVDRDADVNAQTTGGQTALICACG
jgi:ankyrin repeat protein